jgi:fructokinase
LYTSSKALIDRMPREAAAVKFNIVGIGEVLWDMLPAGPQLGGAPANFAYHARALGANGQVITRVGNDDLGREVIRRFQGLGLPESTVQVDEGAPTGTATVRISGDGLARFTIQEHVAWDLMVATDEALAAARAAEAICFGSLAQRRPVSRHTIQQIVAAAPANALRVFDINLRQNYYSRELLEQSLHLANVLKLNQDELPVLAKLLGLKGASGRADEGPIEELAEAFHLRLVALTRGPDGSLLYENGRWSECASKPVQVIDTVGAGDAFTAAMVLGLLRGLDLDKVNSIANEVARYVCSQAGATPRLPAEFA